MPTHAATATPTSAAFGLLLLALAIVTAGYLLACWLRPFGPCRRCRGTGRRRFFGACRRCDGTGRQLRPGRRAINYLRALHAKGSK